MRELSGLNPTYLTLANSLHVSVLFWRRDLREYLSLLAEHDPPTWRVMCRRLLSVDWRGYVFDCDFNQMLDLPVLASDRRLHLRDLLSELPIGAPIRRGEHCWACTAGQGSSCSGALAA